MQSVLLCWGALVEDLTSARCARLFKPKFHPHNLMHVAAPSLNRGKGQLSLAFTSCVGDRGVYMFPLATR